MPPQAAAIMEESAPCLVQFPLPSPATGAPPESPILLEEHEQHLAVSLETPLQPAQQQSPKKKRSVRFSNLVKIHNVLHLRDMSDDEKSRSWLNGYDKEENRKVIHSTVYLMKTGVASQLTDDDFVCPRGLEAFCDNDRSARIEKSLKIALAMQRMLRRVGSKNPELIARAYRKYTVKSQRQAIRKALSDQADRFR